MTHHVEKGAKGRVLADRTVRDVTVSETQVLAIGRAAARARDPETKKALQRIVDFWHENEATERVMEEPW